MAECKVFTECCTGQTSCNKKVTIGYLKNFIKDDNGNALLKDSNGNDVTVSGGQGDAYEPTFAELTGGTYLPVAYDAGTNRASSNIDGITVNGSYSNTDTVKQNDLILSYNRHKSLTVSGGKTFDKCGDSATVCATWVLEKTVKSISVCDPLTYSYSTSDVYDTQCAMNFSACNWLTIGSCSNNCVTISAGQNGTGHSSTRSCNVTASLVYKGATKSSSNSTIISQPGVGGYWYHYDTSYDGVTAYTYNDREYDCDGGSFTVYGTGEYTYYYYWIDDCNNSYYSETSANTWTEELTSVSDSFPNCPAANGGGSKTLTITYHGLSDSITFTQVCACEACVDFTTYGSGNGTATCDECGGNVTVYATVSATIHHKGLVDGICVETGTTPTSYTQSITVNIPENTEQGEAGCTKTHTGSKTTAEGGTINYTITQSCVNPCGGCQGEVITRTWTNTSTTINACDTSATVAISGTETKSYDNCEDVNTPITTSVTFNGISTNETNQSTSYTRTFEDATVTIYQNAGPCHGCTGETATTVWNDTAYTVNACDTSKTALLTGIITRRYGNCDPSTEPTSATYEYTFTQNTGTTERTLTFYYPNQSAAGHATITITQPGGCACANPTATTVWNNVTTTAEACDTGKTVTITGTKTTKYSNCDDKVESVSATETFTFGKNNTNVATSHTFNYPDSTSAGRAIVTVNQAAGPCECGSSSVTVNYADKTVNVDECDSSTSLTISYTSTTSYTNSYCTPLTATGETSVSYTFGQNMSSNVKTNEYAYPADRPEGYATIIIHQDAGPCPCNPTSTSYTVGNVTCDCYEHAANSISIPYTATTHYSNCADSSVTGNTSYPNAISCNNTTSTRTFNGTYHGESYTVTQEAGDCCHIPEPCDCQSSMSVSTAGPIEFSWNTERQSEVATSANPDSYLVTVTYDTDCIEYVNYDADGDGSYFDFDYNDDGENGTFKFWVLPTYQNTSGRDYEVNITFIGFPYDREGEEDWCKSTPIQVIQSYKTDECSTATCGDLTITSSSTTLTNASQSSKVIGTYQSTCASAITATSSNNWLTVNVNTLTKNVVASCDAQGCETSSRSSQVTLSWEVNGSNCSSSWTVTQEGDSTPCTNPCTCNHFSANTNSVTFDSSGTLTDTHSYTITATCDGTFSLDYDSNIINAYLQNGRLYATATTNSSYSSDITGTIDVLLDSSTCHTWSYTIQRQSCSCYSLSNVNVDTTNISSDGASRFVVLYVNADTCGSLSATPGSCDPLFTSVGTGTSGSYYVVSATVSSNSDEDAKSCNIDYTYGVKNSSITCSADSVTVTIEGTGACECSSANIQITGRTNIPAPYGTYKIGSFISNCTNGLSFDVSDTNVSNVYYSDGDIYATVDSNDGSYSRNFRIDAYINGTKCTSGTCTQLWCNCTQASLYVDTTSVSVSSDGGTITRSYSYSCGSVSASASTSWITASTSNGYVYITVSSNPSTTAGRNGVVRVYLDGYATSCYKQINISQDKAECDCTSCDLYLNGEPNIPMTGGSATIGYFSATCTNNLTFTGNSYVSSVGSGTTGTSGNYTTGTVTGNVSSYSGYESRSVTFGIKLNGETCSASGTGTQTGECTCSNSNFNVDTQDHYVSSGGGSYTDIAYTANCGSVTATTTANTMISGLTVYNGYVRVYCTENTSISSRSGYVRVYLKGHVNDCYKLVKIVQNPGQPPCQCSNFAITNAPYSATCHSSSSANSVNIATFEGNCGSITSITSSNTDLVDGLTADTTASGYIYGNIKTNCGAARQATITVKYTANGSSCTNKTFVVKQCSGSIIISPSNGTASSCSGGTVTFTVS